MSVVLAANSVHGTLYVKHTPVREWDNRKLIITTSEVSQAKIFATQHEAMELLSKCVTNGRQFKTEPYQTNALK